MMHPPVRQLLFLFPLYRRHRKVKHLTWPESSCHGRSCDLRNTNQPRFSSFSMLTLNGSVHGTRSFSWSGAIPSSLLPFFLTYFFWLFVYSLIFLKIFIEFITLQLLLYVLFFFFWPQGMWDLSSPTRYRTHTPALEGEANHWTAREVPPSYLLQARCQAISCRWCWTASDCLHSPCFQPLSTHLSCSQDCSLTILLTIYQCSWSFFPKWK